MLYLDSYLYAIDITFYHTSISTLTDNYYLPKVDDLKTFKFTVGMDSSEQDLTALALDVGILKASGWMESTSSVLSQIILAIEVLRT